MAEEVAVGLLAPAIEQLAKLVAKPIARQFNYLCCFTSNINSLKDEAKKLDDATEGLEREVQTARDNVQEPVPAVKTWLDDSKKINDEINGILNDAENVGTGCSKLRARFSLSKRAKKITDRTKELRGEKPIAEFQPGPPAATLTVPGGKTFECESRNKIEDDIMTTLRGGDVNMIGICGMGGLGKTTMARKIRNRVLNENVFQEVAMTVVSQQVDISKIQVEIGGSLGLDLKGDSSESRVQKLHARLSGTKRTLLILDDVWEKLVLVDFGIPLDSKWCTILLTSRKSDVLRAMDVKIFGMEVLSEEEAWSFFRERVGTCVDNMKLNSIAKKATKECRGLPIALTSVSTVLKDEDDVSIWDDALRQLSHSDPDIPEFLTEVYNPLKLSYDFLGSDQAAKSMFLLCCLFPDDANIPLEYLTYFCMGLGIFRGIGNLKEANDKTRALTKKLKSSSLLLDSDSSDHALMHDIVQVYARLHDGVRVYARMHDGVRDYARMHDGVRDYERTHVLVRDYVRMHDVVRDVCIFIAKQKRCIGGNDCTWISSFELDARRSYQSEFPNTCLLFLDSRYDNSLGFKFDDAFMEGMRELHVLCIQRYSLTTLPHPTQSLGKLNTLILESCRQLETISVVGELVNLEILICRDCGSIEKLPSEMKGLNRLKLLELTGCSKLQSIGRGIISSLVGLEELKMDWSFDRWEAEDREVRENAGLRELEALTNLACLEIDIKDPSLVSENMPLLSKKIVRFIIITDRDSYFPSKFSKAMSLSLERETRLGDWIEMQFLRDTEYLYLSGDGANNVDLARIQNIRCLELRECESMKNVDATVFPYIEYLILWSLPELQEICDGPISSTSFQNLKELKLFWLTALTQFWKSSSVCENNYVPHFTNLSYIYIVKCDSLRNLGQLSMAGKDCLPHLEQLHIKYCSMMEQVFLWNEEESGENKTSIESQQKRHVFPKLKEVKLEDLPNLITFYQGIQGIKFPLLRKMEIEDCPNMKSIIGSCSADIDEISFGNSLEVLVIMNHNPFCSHEIPSSLFNGLKELTINKYVGSMSLLTLSMAVNLVSLRELCIINCNEMIKVIEDEQQVASGGQRILLFPKLVKLGLTCLPKLVTFCNCKCEVELPLLRDVVIQRCPDMENFSLGLIATPNLEDFKTDLTTCVGVGVDVAFDSLKKLVIEENKNPLYHHKIISASLFNGLEELIFSWCKGRMSLFPSSAVGNLVNLRVLKINDCDGILVKVIEDEEEKEDGKVVSDGQIRTLVFPKLEKIGLDYLPNLVSFCEWKCELPSLTKVTIRDCPNMKNFSMGFVAAPNLKIVEIDGHKEIDATKDLNGVLHQHYSAREKVSFDDIEIDYNPFYGHKIPSLLCNGLEVLTINNYEGSMSLFTLSMATTLVSLRKLRISDCDEMMKVIEDEQQVANGGQRILLFPKLEILKLEDLPKLVTFCVSKSEVEFPLLRKVKIERCRNMENFSLGLVATPNLEAFTTDLTTYVGVGVDVAFNSLKKLKIRENENPLYDHKISVPLFNGLEQLRFIKVKGSISLFLSSAVGNLVNLRVLEIYDCDLVKVIEDEEEKEDGKVVSGGERTVLLPYKLEKLLLNKLPNLVRFCDWKCDVELPSLRKVVIYDCPNMENFSLGLVAAPNLEAFETDLTTYVGVGVDVAFNGLKKLVIGYIENPLNDHKISVSLFNGLEELIFFKCKGNMSLFSSAVIGNLVNLKVLRLEGCDNLVKVIEDEEEKEDGKVVSGSVVFPKLEELYLNELPKLVSFCEWKCDVELPSLTKVTIRGCRNMENFSLGLVVAPNLKIVEIDIEEIGATKDLNGLLHQHYIAGREKEINEEEKSSEEKDEIEEEDDQN